MPARSVVLEKLVKYNGETHADITPGEYTQLTGRAGRRGIDVEGHAVVVWQPGLDPRAVAGLASRRTYPLRVVVRADLQHGRQPGRRVGKDPRVRCSSSRSPSSRPTARWSGSPGPLARNSEAIAEPLGRCRVRSRRLRVVRAAAGRDRGTRSRGEPGTQCRSSSRGAAESCWPCTPGTSSGCRPARTPGWAVVIDPDTRTGDRDNPRPLVLTEERHVRRLSIVDFPIPPQIAGRMRIPKHFHAAGTGVPAQSRCGAAVPAGRDRSRIRPGPGRRG